MNILEVSYLSFMSSHQSIRGLAVASAHSMFAVATSDRMSPQTGLLKPADLILDIFDR